MKTVTKPSKGRKPSIKQILAHDSNIEERLITDYEELDRTVKTIKAMGFKVVLTQGVYDLIHVGHAAYLEKARSLGDILIVGVDSDELTRQRKGPDRPIVSQRERLQMLSHLRPVDILTVREVHHDIGDLIRLVQPDILVVSKSTTDFSLEMAKEYGEFCGKIVSLPPQATTSTTARIRNITIEGVEKLAKEVAQLTNEFVKKIRG